MRPAVDIRFVPAVYPREAFDIAHLMRAFGVTKAQAKRQVQRLKEERVFRSTTHQVAIIEQRVGSMAATWLSKSGSGIRFDRCQTISTSCLAAWNTFTTAGSTIRSKNGVRSIPGASASTATASSQEYDAAFAKFRAENPTVSLSSAISAFHRANPTMAKALVASIPTKQD